MPKICKNKLNTVNQNSSIYDLLFMSLTSVKNKIFGNT